MRFFEAKLFLVLTSVLLAMSAVIVLVAGVIVPQSPYSSYTRRSCLVVNSRIIESRIYRGLVTLNYQNLTKELEVFGGDQFSTVQRYLNNYYQNGTLVSCLVMGQEIKIPLSSAVGLIFFTILGAGSLLVMLMFGALLCKESYYKRTYGVANF